MAFLRKVVGVGKGSTARILTVVLSTVTFHQLKMVLLLHAPFPRPSVVPVSIVTHPLHMYERKTNILRK
jgi:hypothetical protein